MFEGRQRHAQIAAVNYRGSVLTALQNVEDDLSSLRALARFTAAKINRKPALPSVAMLGRSNTLALI